MVVMKFMRYMLFRWRAIWTSRKGAALRASRDAKHFEFKKVPKDLEDKLMRMDCS